MTRINPSIKKARRIRRQIRYVTSALTVTTITICTLILGLYMVGIRTSYAVSGSMEPVIYRGDLILSTTNYNGLDKGDIIAYKAHWFQEKTVLHRIKDKAVNSETGQFSGYITRGDNNDVDDPETVKPEQITSEVVTIIPYAGWLINPYSCVLAGLLVAATTGAAFINWESVTKATPK